MTKQSDRREAVLKQCGGNRTVQIVRRKSAHSPFRVTILIALCMWSVNPDAQIFDHSAARDGRLRPILDYIAAGWGTLTRSTASCKGIADSKVTEEPVLYLPEYFPVPESLETGPQGCEFNVQHLPLVLSRLGQVKANGIQPPGLLYLEKPYVVPGGRFNEMYGWDSYFIIRGLLRSGKIDLAKGMVDNFFFEIENYGGVLNANRTYYLTRSQPPFLSSMIVAVCEAEKAHGTTNRAWLQKAYRMVERDYAVWVQEQHLADDTGLSRYYDLGDGPVMEGLHDEINYYHDVLAYFVKHHAGSEYLDERPNDSLSHSQFKLEVCKDNPDIDDSKCTHHVALSTEYYKGDRSMRESGFDITFRFGPYGAETHHYAPVCLNSLLYKTETDMEKMSAWLDDKQAEQVWHERAEKRKKIVQTLLWNAQAGMFFDYDFKTRKLSSYVYVTTFYPLWAGIATDAQAKAVAGNLGRFEQRGGLTMGTRETGVQWDYPYGWAPIQLIAVEGLRRYGYDRDADRISYKFLAMVLDNFERDHNIREKYNVVSDVSNIQVAEGYRDNVIGFGWTNAVFLELLSSLPESSMRELSQSRANPQ